jgi:hypothetical protein
MTSLGLNVHNHKGKDILTRLAYRKRVKAFFDASTEFLDAQLTVSAKKYFLDHENDDGVCGQ